jgi:D-alanyl-D-alanine endopeptidase (penicillin-binding protein 7)
MKGPVHGRCCIGAVIAVLASILLAQSAVANSKSPTKRSTSTQRGPEVRSHAALVVDAANAEVLFARNADKPRPIASLTKLMTALVVLESGQSLSQLIDIAREDRVGTQGAPSRLQPGMQLTRGDLLHLALMSSDNRAAHAVGREYPGGTRAFVNAMNVKAKAIGMTQSRFVDASGLSASNVASASDVAKLVLAASSHAAIRDFSTDGSHAVRVAKHALEFRNTNYLVTKADWQIDVQKTGYTSDAGQCLAMKTVIQGRSVVIVLLDSFGKYTRTADARRIRRWLEARATQTLARQTLSRAAP